MSAILRFPATRKRECVAALDAARAVGGKLHIKCNASADGEARAHGGWSGAIGGLTYGVVACDFPGCQAVFGVPLVFAGTALLFMTANR